MIHELLQITGSHKVVSTLIVPKDTGSAQTATGSVAHQNGELFIYNGENWQTLGAQSGITQPDFSLSYLVVAGGGGGGGWGGGGGAGGLLSGSIDPVTSGSTFTMTVGAGSAGGQLSQTAGGYVQGVDGTDSSLAGTGYTTVTATGGGGGGRHNSSTVDNGRDGGSGGGAGMNSGGSTGAGGSGIAGQGFDGGAGGGASTYYYRGGGGGGASQVGQNGNGYSAGGEGGSGSLSSITGTSVRYAGGGGSHTDRRGGGGVAPGGPGGGGAGGGYQPDTHAGDGTANTGGGGGGSYGYANSHQGGGGSGVIVVSYDSGSLSGVGGLRIYNNSKIAHIFNSSGTFSVSGPITHTHSTLDVFGDNSCLALYQLDGNANDRGGNYNGTATSVTYAQGYINDAGVFNGSSSIIALHSTAFKLTTYSFSGWIYSDDYNQSGVGIYDGGLEQPGNGTWYGLSIIVHSSKISSYGGDVAGVGGSGFYTGGSSNTTLSNGTWNHVVFVISGTSITGYINGSQDTGLSRTLGANIQYAGTSNTFHLGSRKGTFGTYGYFNGKIDQARIFNKALSASEVSTLYKE